MRKQPIIFLLFLFVVGACSQDKKTLFRLVSSDESGLDFENTVEEKDSINILTVQYMYHGGGVAIADFNNDSLQDIFFTGNMVSNRLYLNRGGLTFEDVTKQSGIGKEQKWNSGVAVADVNADGLPDIYVCATIHKDPAQRANMLFINKGIDSNGIPVFTNEAAQYGVADTGYSQNAAFLDYDKDGDLDLYVLTNLESDKIPSNYRPKITDGSALNNDRLYRNNGNGSFTDVTIEAGIVIEGYGLGIAIADINADGWPDIYIGNDYVSNDVLYINNRNGTFSNEIANRIKHQSLFSMGIDIADVNNDALPDIITLDMLPENNLRRKTVSGAGATYVNYINNVEYGYEFQYMRNMLHINNGDGRFSELGQMAGIHQTDWSWSPLLIDVDNDGYRDLLITNGFPKDVTDRDYVMFKREVGAFNNQRSLIDSIPVLKISNYAFKNNGALSFKDVTKEWGLTKPSFSHGAAFADFDNDGDLDYVINNINDKASLYENRLYEEGTKSENNYLRVQLEGPPENNTGLGAKITLKYGGGKTQFHEHSVYRGYLASVENIVHFGLGQHKIIDTLQLLWPDGNTQQIVNVAPNQVIKLKYSESIPSDVKKDLPGQTPRYVKEMASSVGITYKHKEWDKIDYYRQRTLPHKFSQAGPGLAVGDINGDDLEDIIVGGSALYDETIFLQSKNGSFTSSVLAKPGTKKYEDEGLLFFDYDNDKDLDLYIVSGSYESEDSLNNQDRLYKNNGQGKFTIDQNALPQAYTSGSCVRAADFDADGDLDLFVGGRVITGSYPLPPESCILKNENGIFKNVTKHVSPELQRVGMITDALWTDYNNDDKIDLIVTGEFMPVTIFQNKDGKLSKVEHSGFENYSGWWNGITSADFDKDGDTDYIFGNLGVNNYYHISDDHPLRVYAKDFDSNESIDAILSCYFKSENGDMLEYPAHSWDELYAQSPKFRNQFNSFRQYGLTTMQELLQPYDVKGMLVLKVNYPYTSIAENKGDGTFTMKPLPMQLQVAPINGMVTTDINQDGNQDVVMIGNDYGNEVFSGRYDACTGSVLLGNGNGEFQFVSYVKSGFRVDGDAKALSKVYHTTGELLVATQNRDSLRIFRLNSENKPIVLQPQPADSWAELIYADGKKEKRDFYYGSGYLSQSSRRINIPEGVDKIIIHDFAARQRTIEVQGKAISMKAKK